MRIYHGFDELPAAKHFAATVGSYDGVHRGHGVLLEQTRQEARALGIESLVVTFDPHPRLALDPACGMELLTSTNEKSLLIERAGIENLLIIHFDHTFSRLAPSDFLRLLVERVGVRSLVVGYDHRFGRDKSGSHELLERLKGELGLRVVEVAEQEVAGEHVSSTVVRRLILKGEVEHAARLLGHRYLLITEADPKGILTPPAHKLLPKAGSYEVLIGGEPFRLISDGQHICLHPTPTVSGPLVIEFEKESLC